MSPAKRLDLFTMAIVSGEVRERNQEGIDGIDNLD